MIAQTRPHTCGAVEEQALLPLGTEGWSKLVVVRELQYIHRLNRPHYYKVFVCGEPLHEEHDREQDAQVQADRLIARLRAELEKIQTSTK